MSRNKANDLSWIWTAPDRHVRAILLSVCDDDQVHRRVQARRLDFEKAFEKKPSFMRACDDVFDEDDEDDDESDACEYHPEPLELDEDSSTWDDWPHFMDMDISEHRRAYPDGFVFPCCNGSGTSPGCTNGPHEADPARSRKGQGEGFEPPPKAKPPVKPPAKPQAVPAVPAPVAGAKRKTDQGGGGGDPFCMLCEKHFSRQNNHREACVYHPGEFELDDTADIWEDMYDEPWDVDTEEMREDHPEGFYWDCCGDHGRTAGCETSRHRTYSDPSDSEDDDKTQADFSNLNAIQRPGKKQKP